MMELASCVERDETDLALSYFKQLLGHSSASALEEWAPTLFSSVSTFGCSDGSTKSEGSCTGMRCNWNGCSSSEEANCTVSNCQDGVLGSHFCALKTSKGVRDLTRVSGCYLLDEGECTKESGNLIVLKEECMLTSLNSRSLCLPSDRCESRSIVCESYCFEGNATNESECDVLGLKWDGTVNICKYGEDVIRENCVGTWWEGRRWESGSFESELRCSIGWCSGDDSVLDKETCVSKPECSISCPNCTMEECGSLGECNDFEGCVVTPFTPICDVGLKWTGLGCYDEKILNEEECTRYFFFFSSILPPPHTSGWGSILLFFHFMIFYVHLFFHRILYLPFLFSLFFFLI